MCCPPKRCLLKASVVLLASWPLTTPSKAQVDDWQKRFQDAWTAAQAAEEAENWEEAVRHYQQVKVLLPPEPVTRQKLATVLARVGRKPEALAELAAAVEFGWSDADGLAGDPAFENLRGEAEFEKLMARARAVGAEAVVVYVPPEVDRTRAVPLIVTLHGRGENPHMHIAWWRQAARRVRAVVVAPRGSVRLDNGISYAWGPREGGRSAGTKEAVVEGFVTTVNEAIDTAAKECVVDPKRVLLAGYSEGAAVALHVLTKAPDRFAGVWSMNAAVRPLGESIWKTATQGRKLRVYLLAGEQDKFKASSEEVYEELVAAGIDSKLVISRGAGHEPPEDYENQQVAGIEYLLGK